LPCYCNGRAFLCDHFIEIIFLFGRSKTYAERFAPYWWDHWKQIL